jgi:hypothetical protein
MYNCKQCQHKKDKDCPCTVPGTCDFTPIEVKEEEIEREGKQMVG